MFFQYLVDYFIIVPLSILGNLLEHTRAKTGMLLSLFCSQLLPLVGSIIRLLTNYFETCTLPELRIKVYAIMKVLLLSLGVGRHFKFSTSLYFFCLCYANNQLPNLEAGLSVCV